MTDSQQQLNDFSHVPVIDIAPLCAGDAAGSDVDDAAAKAAVAQRLHQACTESGFFYIVGHGVDEGLCKRLEELSRRFFALDVAEKLRIGMDKGGRAWRGYFRVGDELTSGKPDQKEGIYFGSELPDDHLAVVARTPMFGKNLFPQGTGFPADEFRAAVLEYLARLESVGHALMRGIALSLGLDESYFADRYTADPLLLFRIFNYPFAPRPAGAEESWGVGEHTDYGLLTILLQDDAGGLQVKSKSGWVDAPPIAGSFVCNIGDMLDHMTRGLYRSTPHRVLNRAGRDRLSFPFFFDPNFFAEMRPIEGLADRAAEDDSRERWDQANVHAFRGSYGDYVLNKVAKVFPQLRQEVL